MVQDLLQADNGGRVMAGVVEELSEEVGEASGPRAFAGEGRGGCVADVVG